MHIVIAGGSGLVGKALIHALPEEVNITILSRKESEGTGRIRTVQWMHDTTTTVQALRPVDVFINLAGRSINDGRWTKRDRELILSSRLQASEEVVRIIEALPERPSVVIQASAVGVYATSETARYTEQSSTEGDEFLQRVVHEWEEALQPLDALGIRTVFTRFGVILSNEGGAFPLMTLPYRLFIGGPIASGKQWVSWVHIDDVVGAIIHIIRDHTIAGPVNVTAPFPIQMNGFGTLIGRALRRPHLIPVPTFALRTVLGQKHILVTKGQYVEPATLLAHDYHFQYDTAKAAVTALLVEE